MASIISCGSWSPELWDVAGRRQFEKFQADEIRTLPEILPGTLVALVVQRFAGSNFEWLRAMIERSADEIGRTPDDILFRSNPFHLTLVTRLIAKEGIELSPNAVEYLRFLRDALNEGSVSRWQAPALELLLGVPKAKGATIASADFTPRDYLKNFGQVLGDIEDETRCGTKPIALDRTARTLLYAGSSQAIAFDDLADGARALRCLHYVVADDRDRRHEEVLLDAICARQESEGHFGPHGQDLAEQLTRAFACLWAIAEVCSNYRLVWDVAFADGQENALPRD
jgi:hypothetical protein